MYQVKCERNGTPRPQICRVFSSKPMCCLRQSRYHSLLNFRVNQKISMPHFREIDTQAVINILFTFFFRLSNNQVVTREVNSSSDLFCFFYACKKNRSYLHRMILYLYWPSYGDHFTLSFNEYLAIYFAGLSLCSCFVSFFSVVFNLFFRLTFSVSFLCFSAQFKGPSGHYPGVTEGLGVVSRQRQCLEYTTYSIEW
jgi:hypothetical protein